MITHSTRRVRFMQVKTAETHTTAPEIRRISKTAWFVLILATVATFVGFIILDPEPSLLLAACTAANVALMLWAIYRFYALDLLLSPMAAIFLSAGAFLRYSWANLGSRIAGPYRFNANPGSLEFYPLAAFLCTLGLAFFCYVVFGPLRTLAQSQRIRYRDLDWQPWQAVVAAFFAGGILFYLSLKYEFLNGYFNVSGQLDRWLSSSYYSFVVLAVVIGVSVTTKAMTTPHRLMGAAGILMPILFALGVKSRTFMLLVVVVAAVCWITLRPRQVRSVALASALVVIVLIAYGTVVKSASTKGQTSSILDNLDVARQAQLTDIVDSNSRSLEIDLQYRLAGLELPAALLSSLSQGTAPMYGEGLYEGVISALPSFLRPPGLFSERLAIQNHFVGRGLYFSDSIGVPLSSGLADWGMWFGPLIYVVMALYYLGMWRVAQKSSLLFVAYLTTWGGGGEADLFWEWGLYLIRSIGFSYLILLLAHPLLMPRWSPQPERVGEALK